EVVAEVKDKKVKVKVAKEPYDPWSLSATTLNQKYSQATGKSKNIKAVDEKKVAVGDIHIEKSDRIDPYAELEALKKSQKKANSVNTNKTKEIKTSKSAQISKSIEKKSGEDE
ncbi:MAG: hypothetical protein RSC44_05465, partial [Clostridia bacterium]